MGQRYLLYFFITFLLLICRLHLEHTLMDFINTILQILKHEGESTVNFGIALIGAFIVYLVDANLNFPNARVIMQLSLVLVATTSLFYTKKFQLNED